MQKLRIDGRALIGDQPVRFVEHQRTNGVRLEFCRGGQLAEAARRTDHDVRLLSSFSICRSMTVPPISNSVRIGHSAFVRDRSTAANLNASSCEGATIMSCVAVCFGSMRQKSGPDRPAFSGPRLGVQIGSFPACSTGYATV
jgi:hypothetical protein